MLTQRSHQKSLRKYQSRFKVNCLNLRTQFFLRVLQDFSIKNINFPQRAISVPFDLLSSKKRFKSGLREISNIHLAKLYRLR